MIKSLHSAATGMKAQQTNMDTVANNIANVSTLGFKKGRPEFQDLMYQNIKSPGAIQSVGSDGLTKTLPPVGVQVGGGVKVSAIDKDFSQGSTKVTNQAFDLEIQGKGFFIVQMPDGGTGYTRDGAFKKGPDGRLQDRGGNILQPEIVVPPNASGIEIGKDGQVNVLFNQSSRFENIGQIQLASFINPSGLINVGRNLFTASSSSGVPQAGAPGENGLGSIAQGQLETSNVNIVDEMVNMISAQRAYETNAKVIQATDQMLQQINTLR